MSNLSSCEFGSTGRNVSADVSFVGNISSPFCSETMGNALSARMELTETGRKLLQNIIQKSIGDPRREYELRAAVRGLIRGGHCPIE